MTKIIFLTSHIPSDQGHGGNHRSYQVLHDLQQIIGSENIITICPEIKISKSQDSSIGKSNIKKFLSEINLEIVSILNRLGKRFSKTRLIYDLLNNSLRSNEFIGYSSIDRDIGMYLEEINQIKDNFICVMDHPRFYKVIQYNKSHNIPTIYCPQNIESLDYTKIDFTEELSLYNFVTHFVKELGFYEYCDERLLISKVESGLIGGLGLSCKLYPYFPVGSIRKRMDKIRSFREHGEIDSNLFLMLGSAVHPTTKSSFSWLIDNVQEHGLPRNTQLIIGGLDTDLLLPSDHSTQGLELRGWIVQTELDHLLTKINALIIPQFSGFGALTRLAEFSYAGLPVLTSIHPSFALDMPPGIDLIENDWATWFSKIQDYTQSIYPKNTISYNQWEERQPKPMQSIINKYL